MVKNWEKKLYSIIKSSEINFDSILEDIFSNNLDSYDVSKLSGYKHLYRIRVGNYRIIFEKNESGNVIRDIGSRQSIYKKL